MRSGQRRECSCRADALNAKYRALNFVSDACMREADGHIFRAFVGSLRASWRPCRDCGQIGGLQRGFFHGMGQWALPGAPHVPDLLALSPHSDFNMEAVHVEASQLHTLRVGHAFVALMKAVAVVYYNGSHYICDVDLGTDDADPDVASWYRYDHMKLNGRGRRLPEPPSKDQFFWNEKGPYRVSIVVYRRAKELATTPPCDLSFPVVAHHFEVDSDLVRMPPPLTAAPGGVERGAVATQNATWCRTGRWHVDGADHPLELAPAPVVMHRLQGDAGAGDAASAAATRLCVVAAPAASLLRQRAAACAEMSGREVALVSFGSPTSPASGYGQGRSGPEEELCRLMPAFHGQLTASAAYPLGSGAALVTKTLLCRESGNYAPIHPAVPVTVISTHLGASDSRRGGTAEWHAALRIGAQTALWAAQRSQITDLVLCGEAFGADPALATEGVATFCDVLRSQEFAGAFRTVVLGVCRENEGLASAHLATIDHRSSTGERVPSTAESAELAAELERHLREWRGWTEHAGEPIDIAELAGAMGPIVGWACDATRLAVAARVLQTAGKLSLSEANGSNTSTKTVERGQPSDIPGIGWGVESYAPAQANALPRGPSSRCCLILSDVRPCLGSFRTTACHWEAHTEGVAGVALREATGLRHVQNLRVAILIAGNAGRPGGACRDLSGKHEPAKLHAGHKTQEEDLVSNWLLCLPAADRRQAFGRITLAWGLKDASGLSNSTVQGVDYTSAGAPPRIYADAWALGGIGEVVSGGAKSGGAFSTSPADRVRAQLVFCAAPNAHKPGRHANARGSMVRTFSAQAQADRDYFEEGRAWAVYAALVAARDAGSTVVVMPYIGGGLYAGRFANDDDLQSRFRASVNAILESGRLPGGAQMEALGKHFRAVHIVALR